VATFLFAAGQETTARLLASALRYLAEHPEAQDELRARPQLIPHLIEETLRYESPVKADFRLARRTTTIGGVEVAAGTPVMLLNGAANRDPGSSNAPPSSVPTAATSASTSPSDAGSTRARAARWRASRAGSAWNASSPGPATSGFPKSTTGPRAPGISPTNRPGSSAA
jgi:Cytochrome P450